MKFILFRIYLECLKLKLQKSVEMQSFLKSFENMFEKVKTDVKKENIW